MATLIGPKNPEGNVFMIDAGNSRSYPGTGTTLYDISGNNNHATLQGTTIANGVATLLGQGERDGSPTGDYISVPSGVTQTNTYTTQGNQGLSGCTYDLWFRFSGIQTYGQCIYFDAGTIGHIEFKGEGGTSTYFRTEARRQNGKNFGANPGPTGGFAINEWHNLTISFSTELRETNNPVRWYKNGELFFTGYMANGTYGNGEYFRFNALGRATGSSAYLYSNSFLGDIALCSIYDNVLSEQQIENLHYGNARRFT